MPKISFNRIISIILCISILSLAGCATQNPSNTSVPQSSEEPSNTPVPQNSEKPSNTPVPQNSEKPSNTPVPQNSEKPSNTPVPQNSEKPSNTSIPTQNTEPVRTPVIGSTEVGDITANYTKYDTDESETSDSMTYVTFNGNSVDINGAGASFSAGKLTVAAEGTYYIRGTLTEGQIRICVGEEEKVKLVLAGVTLTCSSDSPIYAETGDKLIITLASGTVNTITDSDKTVKSDTDTRGAAAIYSCISLSINGNGTLNVSSSYNNAIGTKKTLKIINGTLILSAENAGVKGNNAVNICGGNITINSKGDGIKTEEEEDTSKGYVFISGGTIDITTESDGINGSLYTIVTGGIIDVTTTGTEVSTDDTGDAPVNVGGRPGGGWGGGAWGGGGWGGNTVSAPASKGIKAGSSLLISGGDITIVSTGHCIHSANTITIGGEIIMNLSSSKGKGIQGHGDVTIDGGKIIISNSTEGIESKLDIYVNGGDITIYSTDDGINIANSTNTLYVNGGNLNVSVGTGDTDGIDSNGSVSISGGTTTVYKPSSNAMSGVFDVDRTVTITGGNTVALGTSSSPSNTYKGLSVKLSNVTMSPGTYKIVNSNNTVLFSFEVKQNVSSAWISSELFVSGENYKLMNGENTVKTWVQ